MKSAVITINIGTKYAKMAKATIPTHRAFAERIGADFIVITSVSLPFIDTEYSAYWAKFELYNYLNEYDRIIYLDLDTVVMPNCPNLLELVPEYEFGALFETDFGIDQTEEIQDMLGRMPIIEWEKDYFNVGVMVFSKCHQSAFLLNKESQEGRKYPEQTLLNYNIHALGLQQFHLDQTFNHMCFLNRNFAARGSSHIIHYAGIAQEVRELLIVDDVESIAADLPLLQGEDLLDFLSEELPGKNFSDFRFHLYKDEEIGLDVSIR